MNWAKGKVAIAKRIGLDLTHPQVWYGRALQRHVYRGAKWLDVGCGYQILPSWALPDEEQARLAQDAAFVAGVDVDPRIAEHPHLTYRVAGLGGALPFRDQAFDLVTANMVIEHIDDAPKFLADVLRVLRPGGRFLFHTPNIIFWVTYIASFTPDWVKKPIIWKMEQRRAEDVFPTRYELNTPWRIERLAKKAGFEVEEITMVGSNRIFDRFGPLGWAECFVQKGISTAFDGRFNSNIIAVLRRR